MKPQRLTLLLVASNLVLVFCLAAQFRTDSVQTIPSVLRAQRIELVNEQGVARAQLNVEPSGEVVFRLRDAKGTIRVKLGASEEGSGLVMLNDTAEPGLQALSKTDGTRLTLINKDGRKRVVEP